MDVRKLNTIQTRNKLNNVFALGAVGAYGERSEYAVVRPCAGDETTGEMIAIIKFQRGARGAAGSISGILNEDALEMVRDRLMAFQDSSGILNEDALEMVRDRLMAFQDSSGASHENAMALQHVEAALMYLNRRVEDRA